MALSRREAQQFYDGFGAKQDGQGFYEDPAIDELCRHGHFGAARAVFEFGCGTGRLAARLLKDHATGGRYLGVDLSPVMVRLAAARVEAFEDRALVVRSDGSIRFPLADRSVDRVISTYVLDLLATDDIDGFLDEAHRVLMPQGLLCTAGLTSGISLVSMVVAAVWGLVYRVAPARVGGCRPLRLSAHVDATRWRVRHRKVVTRYGIPSEAMVLERL